MNGKRWRGRIAATAVWMVAACGGGSDDDGADDGGPSHTTEDTATDDGAVATTGADDGSVPPSMTTMTSATTTAAGDDAPAQCEDDGQWGGDDGDSGDDGSDTIGMDDDMPLVVEVADVQQHAVAPGDLVAFEQVVVTTPSTLTETGQGYEVFVQDPLGGPYSGIRLRMLVEPSTIAAVGDAVTVVGRVRSRDDYVLVDVSGPSATFAKLGTGVAAPPPVIDPAVLVPGSPQARPWEGVLVRVEQVVVTDADPCDGEFEIAQTARVDDRFAPGQLPQPGEGTMLGAVEGVLVYAVDAYELAPRDASDVE